MRNKIHARKTLSLLVKTVVTISLVYWLVSRVDGEAVGNILTRANFTYILLSLATLSAVFSIGCLRWWILIGHLGLSIPFRQAFSSYYLGLFFNNFLPTGIGGDVARTVHLNLSGHSAKSLISSALADRAIGLVVMLLMGGISVLLSPELRMEDDQRYYLIALIVLGILSGSLLFWFSDRFPIEALSRRYRHTRIRKAIVEVVHLCLTYRSAIRLVISAMMLSALAQSLVILTYYLLGSSIGIKLSLTTFFALVSIVQLATSLPVSIGGLGIREGTLVTLLVSVGIDMQPAAALSLLFLLTLWFCSLPGAVITFLDRGGLRSRAERN